MLRDMNRVYAGGLAAGALIAAVLISETNAAPEGTARTERFERPTNLSTESRDASFSSGQRRIREGTVITDVAGYFRQDGDGATFVTDEDLELGGLPNLNLERVARTLKSADESESIRWSVSGTVTEFAGRNYLLISRAVYKATTPPPLPEELVN